MSNYRETQQKLARLRRQAQQNQQLADQLAASNSTLAELQRQPTQRERQQEQEMLVGLQQQLANEQAEKEAVQRQLARLQHFLQQGAALVSQQLSPDAASADAAVDGDV